MTRLRVVLEPLLGPPTEERRYADDLTRALVASAPDGVEVGGLLPAAPEQVAEELRSGLGLAFLERTRLARREQRIAWERGIALSPRGMTHAASLTAPLARHDRSARSGDQLVATIGDVRAWTDPDSLPAREAAYRRAMGRRAERFADAIVVPTHTVADAVVESLDVADRIRVIAAAPHPHSASDLAAVGDALALPPRYVLAILDDPAQLDAALAIVPALPDDVSLVAALAAPPPSAQERSERVVPVVGAGEVELAAMVASAALLVHPAESVGFGLGMLQAISAGVPIVHVDSAEAREIIADAGVAASAAELGDAVRGALDDASRTDRLEVLGRDRARAFSWHDTAEKVWQLHADL